MRSALFGLLAVVGCHAADLSIVECNLHKKDPGPWILAAQIASAGATPVDRDKVQMKICLFERYSPSVEVPAEPGLSFQWTSLPLNWKKGSAERFEVHYPGPKTGSGTSYSGYAVAVYYDNILHEALYSRNSIKKKFPFPETFK